jgi:hypothetical protein
MEAVGVLGAQPPPLSVVIRVKNVPEVVAKQGGALATLAQRMAPEFVNVQFHEEFKKKLTSELAGEGVQADVEVMPSAGVPGACPPPSPSHLARDIGIGVCVGIIVQSIFLGMRH